MSYSPLPEVVLVFGLLALGGPVLLVLSLLLLAVPASRRRTGLRRTAYVFLALALCLFALSAPWLAEMWGDYRQKREFEAQTHHLTAPQIFGGVTFPADSMVHVSKEGIPEYGTLPDPTPVGGLVLIGRFHLYGVVAWTRPVASWTGAA